MFKFEVKNASRTGRDAPDDVTAGKMANHDNVTEEEKDDFLADIRPILYSRKWKNKNEQTQVESKSSTSFTPNNRISNKETGSATMSASKSSSSISKNFDSTSRNGKKQKLDSSLNSSLESLQIGSSTPIAPAKTPLSLEEINLLPDSVCGQNQNDEVLLIQPENLFPSEKGLSNPFSPTVPSTTNSKLKKRLKIQPPSPVESPKKSRFLSLKVEEPNPKNASYTISKPPNTDDNTLTQVFEEPKDSPLSSDSETLNSESSFSPRYLSYENNQQISDCAFSADEQSRSPKTAAKSKQNLSNCCNSSLSEADKSDNSVSTLNKVKPLNQVRWETCNNWDGTQLQLAEVFTLGKSGISTGFMKISPGVSKPLTYNAEYCLTFLVASGTVNVQVYTDNWRVEECASFLVKKGYPYRITNIGERDCLLYVTMIPINDRAN